MLAHLQIRNFVLIEELSLSFSPGFNALTGETGAGKSLVATSLDLLLGRRASSELVRKSATEAEVEGIFDITDENEVKKRLQQAGLPVDDELLIRRVIPANGRTRCYVNGKLASVGVLAGLAKGLASVMSQHEQHTLFDAGSQLAMLDGFGGYSADLEKMSGVFKKMRECKDKYEELLSKEHDRASRLDYLSYQLDEINETDPEKNELNKLDKEIDILKHQTALLETTTTCASELYETNGSIFERMGNLCRELEELTRFDNSLSDDAKQLAEATILIEETARSLGAYSRNLDTEPGRLDDAEERREAIRRLCRKHGTDSDGLHELTEAMKSELKTLKSFEHSVSHLKKELDTITDTAMATARALSKKRHKAAVLLSKKVTAELKDLSFAKALFKVAVTSSDQHPGDTGMDSVDFLVELNPGEGAHPLKKVASGGELSRMMLAIKKVLAGVGPVGTYVFDEIDAGIGGNVAQAVGRKLSGVARHHQLICITHMPQIAALADAHYHVSKSETGGRTVTEVNKLENNLRVEEISRMLGGSASNKKMTAAAKELIKAH